MKKRKIRAVTSSVLAFLIAVCSAILVILLSLAATVFHGNFILQKLDQKFCSAMADTITQSMKDVAASSSLEDSVFDGVITTSAVSRDMSLKARETLAGVSSSFDSTPLRESLMERFRQYAQEHGYPLGEEEEANLSSLAALCVQEYERLTTVPFLQTFAPIRQLFDRVFPIMLIGLSVLLILMLLLLFHIHPFKHQAVRYVIYALSASSLMILPAPLVIFFQGAYEKLTITPVQMQTLFADLARSALLGLIVGGLLVVLITALLFPLIKVMKNNLKKQYPG